MKHFLFILLFVGAFTQLSAIPAFPFPILFTQPNGEQVTIIMKGDEFVRFAQTLDGYTLMYDAEGFFCYAQKNVHGDIEPSVYYAKEISNRSENENEKLIITPKELRFSSEQMYMFQQIRDMVQHENENGNRSTTGVRKLLVVLMQYPDKPFVKTQMDFNDLFNQINYTEYGANGSVKDFFFEVSYNKLDVQTTVVGPYTAKYNHAYYGEMQFARELAREAVFAAYADGVNFAEFAINGVVPSFYMIFAGCGQEAGAGINSIWSHAWNIDPVTLNGVQISSYACSPEHRGASGTNITHIGVICHEFGHSLGSPDYYDTNYAVGGQYDGTGYWDLMASGSWNDNGRTPASPNPRTRVYIYGWADAIVLNSAQTVTIPAARIYKDAFFRINTQTTNEYYILENKIRSSFDNYIPGKNMLIYHCAANMNGMNTTSPQKFYPVAANAPVALPGSGSNCQADYGTINSGLCPWPGNTGKTEFTDTTIPAMLAWNGEESEKPITNIVVHDDYITFDFMGGGERSNFYVYLPYYYGCKVTPMPYAISPVEAGGYFSFVVEKLPSHSNSVLTVTANNIELTPLGNAYTILDIQEDQIIRIEGLAFDTFSITAAAGENGSISPAGTVHVTHSGIKTFQMTPNNGYCVDEIIVDGVNMGNLKSYTFRNITEQHTIYATFKQGGIFSINTSIDTLHFYTTEGVPSNSLAVTISSPDVVTNVTVTAPPKFQIFNNGSWVQTITISKTNLPEEIYIRFNPAIGDLGVFEDILTLISTEAYAEIKLFGSTVLGVHDRIKDRDFIIYPNPTTGELRIIPLIELMGWKAMPDGVVESQITNIEIFDIYGRKLHATFNPKLNSGQNSTFVIDISHLQAGIYFMQIQTEEGAVVRKVIKN